MRDYSPTNAAIFDTIVATSGEPQDATTISPLAMDEQPLSATQRSPSDRPAYERATTMADPKPAGQEQPTTPMARPTGI